MTVGTLLVAHEQSGRYADRIRDAKTEQDSGAGVRVVSGVDIPMLLRVLNYSRQSPQQLCETAVAGGQSGIQQGNVPLADIRSGSIRQVN